jgi:micrococcal nuclease
VNEEDLYNYKAKLIKVIDGDTISVLMDLGFKTHQVRRIRLLGYDACETRTKDLEEKAKGMVQKYWLAFTLSACKYLYIHTKEKDSFGRYLGTVYSNEGENINERFIEKWPNSKAN